MLLFHVDEFGDSSLATAPRTAGEPLALKAGVSEWFLLSAVGVPDSSRKPLAEAIFELKTRHFGPGHELKPWGDTEIKGRYLFRAARSAASGNVLAHPSGYQHLNTPAKVEALLEDFELLLSSFRPLTFCVAVDKRELLKRRKRERKDPLGAAYAYLEQRVALNMERLHAGQGAILVADQQTQHESYFRSGEMNRVRDAMTSRLPTKPNFNLVLDKPLWIDTHLSSWDREILQFADIVAYSVAECLKRGTSPSERCYLWRHIRPHLAVQWTSGTIEGGGVAIYPKPGHYPEM